MTILIFVAIVLPVEFWLSVQMIIKGKNNYASVGEWLRGEMEAGEYPQACNDPDIMILLWQARKNSIPLTRAATADDIAASAVFLASDMASYITGSTIDVNGGLHCN